MSELETPDEDGGIDAGTNVSFIVIPAKKGIQAAAVIIADPPEEPKTVEVKEHTLDPMLETSFADMGVSEPVNTGPVDLDDPNAW